MASSSSTSRRRAPTRSKSSSSTAPLRKVMKKEDDNKEKRSRSASKPRRSKSTGAARSGDNSQNDASNPRNATRPRRRISKNSDEASVDSADTLNAMSDDDPSDGSFGCDAVEPKRRQQKTQKNDGDKIREEARSALGKMLASPGRPKRRMTTSGMSTVSEDAVSTASRATTATRRGRMTKGLNLGEELDRISRHQSMKAAYRTNGDDMTLSSSVHPRESTDQSVLSRSRHGGDRSVLSRSRHGRDDRSVLSRSRHSSIQKVDGGPLNMFLNEGAARRRMTDNGLGGDVSVSMDETTLDDCENTQAEEWLQQRSNRQDEIISGVRKLKLDKEVEETASNNQKTPSNIGGERIGDDEDEPQTKQRPIKRVVKAVARTAGATRNAAIETVNAVRDPKRTVKNIGSVARNTVDVVMDPMRAANLMVDVTKDLALGATDITLTVTKAVAEGTMDATALVVEGTAAGVGRVVNDVAGLIVSRDNGDGVGDSNSYNAAELESRRRTTTTLLERVDSVVDPSAKPVRPRSRSRTRTIRARQGQKSFVAPDVKHKSIRVKSSDAWDV